MTAENTIACQRDVLVDIKRSPQAAVSDRVAAIACFQEHEKDVARLETNISDARRELGLLGEEIHAYEILQRPTMPTPQKVQSLSSGQVPPMDAALMQQQLHMVQAQQLMSTRQQRRLQPALRTLLILPS